MAAASGVVLDHVYTGKARRWWCWWWCWWWRCWVIPYSSYYYYHYYFQLLLPTTTSDYHYYFQLLLYSQALHCFAEHARQHPDDFRGKRLLFWHTGGLPGLEAKTADLLHLVKPTARLRPP